LLAGSCIAICLHVQPDAKTNDRASKKAKDKKDHGTQPRNLFKMNLPGIGLKTYSFQYEPVPTKHISLAAGYATMPKVPAPLKSTLLKVLADEDPSHFYKRPYKPIGKQYYHYRTQQRCVHTRQGYNYPRFL